MRNWVEIKTVYSKEITEILRNKRIIITAFLIPLIIFPVVFGAMEWLQGMEKKKLQEEGFRIAIPANSPELTDFLNTNIDVPIRIVETSELLEIVSAKDVDVGIEIVESQAGERVCWFYLLGSEDKSIKAHSACRKAFEEARFEWLRGFLSRDLSDTSIADVTPIAADYRDVAGIQERSGHKIGKILPFILIMMLVSGCSFAAVDLIAGEKERGCFETLLVSPISRQSVIVGKMLVVMVTGFASLLINLFSMFICLKLGLFQGTGEGAFEFTISYGSMFGIFICALPMTILFAASLMLISAKAKTYQSGQTLLMPFSLIALLPAVAATMPGMHSDSYLVFIPIANVVVAMREMLEGTLKWWPMIVGNLVNLGLAATVLYVTVKSLEKEGSLIPGSVSDSDMSLRGLQKDPVMAAFIGFAFVWLAMFFVFAPWQAHNLIIGLIATLWGLIFLSGLMLVRFQKLPLKKTLSLNPASWKAWVGSALFQIGLLPTLLYLNDIVMKFLPIPKGWMEAFGDSMNPDVSTFGLILLMAVSPGICEEILFRGAILGTLRKRWNPFWAIAVSSIMFGFLHFSVYRLFATTIIGVGLGWIVYVTGSIYPAMMAHALNNALALLVLPEMELENLNENWLLAGIPVLIAGILLIISGKDKRQLE